MELLLQLIERFGLLGAAAIGFGFIFYRYINGTIDDRVRISKGYDFSQSEILTLRKENDRLRAELSVTSIELVNERGARTLLDYQKQVAVDEYLDETRDFDRELNAQKKRADEAEERLRECSETIIVLQNLNKQLKSDGMISESDKELTEKDE